MFIKNKSIYFVVPAALALAISACGGGQAGGSASAVGVSVVSTGPITGFGSVFVNGVEYDTSRAQIHLNGVAGTQDDLRLGMMVDVTGTASPEGTTGTATAVNFTSEVHGIVDSVDAVNNGLVVMGQTVVVDDLTVFDGTTLSTLQPGNVVEVSGMVDSSGVIHATRIELKSSAFASDSLLEVKGKVTNLDTVNMTFEVGAQTVDYSSAVLKQLPAGLSDGQLVGVKSTQGFNTDGELIAAIIEGQDAVGDGVNVDEMEIEGLVTGFSSATAFSVNGQAVMTTAQTVYRYGTAADIALNTRLEVEGGIDEAGVLVAAKVIFKPSSRIDVTAEVQAVDASAGTVNVLGIQFTVDPSTQYNDEGVGHVRDFGFKDISVGDRLVIRAYRSGDALIAARIARKPPSLTPAVSIRATLDSVNDPRLQVLGITIVTDGTTSFYMNDAAVTADGFFSAVQLGDTVRVNGTLTGGGTIQATRVERDG